VGRFTWLVSIREVMRGSLHSARERENRGTIFNSRSSWIAILGASSHVEIVCRFDSVD
jgi:hypothetical protein